jgi:uncharacterized protein involved in exopolysaccharide biosynthesis/glycerol-3-phosphate cytidylyltransferase-like family protein
MNENTGPDHTAPEPAHSTSPVQKPPIVPEVGQHEAPRRSVLGALTHSCWRILLLWLLITTPVAFLIYLIIEPRYEAVSRIRIETSLPSLFDPQGGNAPVEARIYEPYLQTEVNLITSDRVLGRAIANRLVANQPMIRDSADAKAEIRDNMVAKIEPNTYLISIALQSRNPAEAAAIVNAVVESYVDENDRYTQAKDANLKANLKAQLTDLGAEIDKKTAELRELNRKGAVRIYKPPINPLVDGDNVQDQEHVNAMIARMVQVDIDLLTAEANLKARLELQNRHENDGQQAPQGDRELEDRIKDVFYADPEVSALAKEIRRVEDELYRIKLLRKASARSGEGGDPARLSAQKEHAKLATEWKELWAIKSVEIRKRLEVGAARQPQVDPIASLEQTIKVLKEKRAAYAEMYKKMEVEQKANNDESFKFSYVQQELTSLLGREQQVKRNLAQVEFQSRQEPYRVVLVDKAEVPRVPANDNRLKYMAIAPIAILLLLLAGFLVSELGARKRVHIAVVPDTAAPILPTFREAPTSGDKMAGISYACRRAQEMQRSGGKVALVEGRFDKIDYSVVHLLQFARMQGNFLIVGLESDRSIQRSGELATGQPTVPQDQRGYLLSLYSFVDLVVTFDRQVPLNLIQPIRPDVLVTSGQVAQDAVAGAEFVRSYGGRVAMCPRIGEAL